jgi:acyl transferase domain-containing protein
MGSGVRISPSPASLCQPCEPNLAFVFTGQGAQWPGMGRQLLERFPVFESVIDDLDVDLCTLPQAPSWTIKDTILEDAGVGSIYTADRSQTVCTALQIALVTLLRHWGIAPTAVVRHSSGDIGAAFAAGHISAYEGLSIAYYRGLVSEKISVEGAMLAVGLGAERATQLLSDLRIQDTATVACINSPESTTISGDLPAVQAISRALEERKVFVRQLKTGGKAYHSHLMQQVGQEYEKYLTTTLIIQPNEASELKVNMFSSVTAQMASKDLVRLTSYWRANLESPVLFQSAIELMVRNQSYHLIEIGPHPALGQPVRDTVVSMPNQTLRYSSSLHRGKSDELCILHLAGEVFMAGVTIDFSHINDTRKRRCANGQACVSPSKHGSNDTGIVRDSSRTLLCANEDTQLGIANGSAAAVAARHGHEQDQTVKGHLTGTSVEEALENIPERRQDKIVRGPFVKSLPLHRSRVFQRMTPYQWHHHAPLWTESRRSFEFRNTKYSKHDLLGSRVPATPGHLAIWRNQLRLTEVPWIASHKLGSTTVFPAAGYIAMAIEALLQIKHRPSSCSVRLHEMYLTNMLVFSAADKEAIEVSTVLEPEQISQTSYSDMWWRLKISSFADGSSAIHANGLIGLGDESSELKSRIVYPEEFAREEQATRTIYNRLAAQGLCFGPQFMSMKAIFTDRHRKLAFASAEVDFRSSDGGGERKQSAYIVHPITIDSLLQTAIVASCKGASEDLHGKVSVEVGSF